MSNIDALDDTFVLMQSTVRFLGWTSAYAEINQVLYIPFLITWGRGYRGNKIKQYERYNKNIYRWHGDRFSSGWIDCVLSYGKLYYQLSNDILMKKLTTSERIMNVILWGNPEGTFTPKVDKSIDGLSGREEAYVINAVEAEKRGESIISDQTPY
jgi:hypothetical protein